MVGGSVAGAGNVISGNQIHGVYIENLLTTGDILLGNFIGTDASGETAIGNQGNGVLVRDSSNNQIGLAGVAGARNIISGNKSDGVIIFGALATGNAVRNNEIGTDALGTSALPNGGVGVFVFDAPNATIGGVTPLSGNVIAGNLDQGVEVFGEQSSARLSSATRSGWTPPGLAPWAMAATASRSATPPT